MFKNPWFSLVCGLILGVVAGYILAERQRVPPTRPAVAGGGSPVLPQGHQPESGAEGSAAALQNQLRHQAAELQAMLEKDPQNSRLMVALGNHYYDVGDWPQAKQWYERALALDDGSAELLVDYGIALRNLGQRERALEALRKAEIRDPRQWRALYNQVIILNFDLKRRAEAATVLERLQVMAGSDPTVPDLSGLEREIMGEHGRDS